MATGDMGGSRTEASPFGIAVFNDKLPLRFDSNYLLIDALASSVTAGDVLAEAERLERAAVLVRHLETAGRLIPGFQSHGWHVHRGLLMAYRGDGAALVDTTDVREVVESVLRPVRRHHYGTEYGATPDVIEQLLDAKLEVARVVDVHFFAALSGDVAISYADLYSDGRTAQVEDVATLEEHRRRGHASRVVSHAVQAARTLGCDLVFLVTDEEGDARRLYQRLGFEELGRYVKFMRRAS
jgi:ribosomal protein S18 acetylase RimI-like enzyme